MLSDIERKVLRILINCSKYNKTPTIKELCTWTGRNETGIYHVLESLAERRYIEWTVKNPEEIVLLKTNEILV